MPASSNGLAPANPFPTDGSSPGGYGAPLGASPGGGMTPGVSYMQMGSSPFQMQPQPTGFASHSTFSPTAMPGGNPFAHLSAQSPPPQQPIQRSFTTPIPGPFASQQPSFQPQQTGFTPQQTGFAPQQTGFAPSAPQQQPFLSQPYANSNPFFNGGAGQGLMAQPQMPFHTTPSPQPFAMGTPFQQQPQQPQQMFAAQAQPMQAQATNPFTNWMQQPSGPTQGGFAGQAGPGQWGTM
ncbi:hypothetical protein EWM64_g3803 [Hericium alpestre]|uniref:Uncharacterized protein n=1 Tax=Hericium alpestre TaxID=135208 RepID=A0A4Z0A169_9AGAM|nr:hypothetical protein EWM64_g3803 [Hericium alpestre]